MMNKKEIVQDDSREKQMADMFKLSREGGRIGVDAYDEHKNEFELKTTTKGSVSTARDLGPNHLTKWRKRYWIIQQGDNTKKGFVPDKSYFFAPVHMEGWFQKIEKILLSDIELSGIVCKLLKDNNFHNKDIERAKWLMHRGKLMNDPNISKGYIEENGILLKNHCPKMLRLLVDQYPITGEKILTEDEQNFNRVFNVS